jgi:glycosyltransferase involved in cell wall biosynthesis
MTARLRVLVVVFGGAGPRVSGPEIRGWAMAGALAERHDVTVAVKDPPSATRNGHRLIPFTRRVLAREARRHDAVIAPVLPPYLFTTLSGASTMTVSDQYDPVDLELSAVLGPRGVSRELASQRAIRNVQLRFADIISCAGERQRMRIREDLATIPRARVPRVVNVPFGLSEPPPASSDRPLREHFPAIGTDDPVVLWWGKVWKWFDADTAIRAFELVVRRRPDARLVISAGKAPNARTDSLASTEEARQLARGLGLLDKNVFFLDEWTPYDRRHAYLQDADVGLTLHANTGEAPFAARARYMDYLWCSLPCVLASGDEVAARFGAAGFAQLVSPGDRQAAAAAILRMIEEEAVRTQARAAAAALMDEYRWSTLVQPLAAALEELAEALPPPRPMSRALVSAVGAYYGRRAVDHAAGALEATRSSSSYWVRGPRSLLAR